jgi:hypothetical protein
MNIHEKLSFLHVFEPYRYKENYNHKLLRENRIVGCDETLEFLDAVAFLLSSKDTVATYLHISHALSCLYLSCNMATKEFEANVEELFKLCTQDPDKAYKALGKELYDFLLKRNSKKIMQEAQVQLRPLQDTSVQSILKDWAFEESDLSVEKTGGLLELWKRLDMDNNLNTEPDYASKGRMILERLRQATYQEQPDIHQIVLITKYLM